MKKEMKVKLLKITAGLVVGMCAGVVITAALKNLVPMENSTTVGKVVNKIGVSVISSLVADQASNYASQLVGVFLEPAVALPMTGSIMGIANA